MQIPPGVATPWRRAAILTPSPIRSPSLSSTTPFCTSIAQRTASTIAAKFDDAAVAGALDDVPMMGVDGGIDEVATEAPQARQCAILVRRGESAVPDNVGDQD